MAGECLADTRRQGPGWLNDETDRQAADKALTCRRWLRAAGPAEVPVVPVAEGWQRSWLLEARRQGGC